MLSNDAPLALSYRLVALTTHRCCCRQDSHTKTNRTCTHWTKTSVDLRTCTFYYLKKMMNRLFLWLKTKAWSLAVVAKYKNKLWWYCSTAHIFTCTVTCFLYFPCRDALYWILANIPISPISSQADICTHFFHLIAEIIMSVYVNAWESNFWAEHIIILTCATLIHITHSAPITCVQWKPQETNKKCHNCGLKWPFGYKGQV